MKFKIEKNIPLPKRAIKRDGCWMKLAADMKEGDSVGVPSKISAQALFSAGKRRFGYKMAVRKAGKGFRVWRVK